MCLLACLFSLLGVFGIEVGPDCPFNHDGAGSLRNGLSDATLAPLTFPKESLPLILDGDNVVLLTASMAREAFAFMMSLAMVVSDRT